jgi:hypothetical protein
MISRIFHSHFIEKSQHQSTSNCLLAASDYQQMGNNIYESSLNWECIAPIIPPKEITEARFSTHLVSDHKRSAAKHVISKSGRARTNGKRSFP